MKRENIEALTDQPLKSKRQDRFNRAHLANKVAKILTSYDGKESFVIGVEGVWGSGKTSFIEMILEGVDTSKNKSDFIIIKFNPWNFSNNEALYIDFFTQLGKSLGKDFLKYGKKLLQTIEIKPSVMGVTLGKFNPFGIESTKDLRKEIEAKLIKQNKKIIVVVDDIDRLDKKETREVFKLVKVNANFPNVLYILAYDREKVERILTDDGFPGSEYLKKIVQVSFAIPSPEPSQIFAILAEELDTILNSKEAKVAVDKYWDNKDWGNLSESGFKNVFKTVRDINRYISSLRLDYLAVGYTEVNPVDFLGIELIRVFAPQMYTLIGENKDLFTRTDSLYGSSGRDDKDTRRKLFEEILSKSDESIRENMKAICRRIFPQIDGLYSNTTYGPDWNSIWRKRLRVCSSDFFKTYFSLSIPVGKLSQIEINEILSSLNHTSNFETSLLKINPIHKLYDIFDTIMDRMDDFTLIEKENLLQSLLNIGDLIKEEQTVGLARLENLEHKSRRLCYHILMRVPQKDRYEILQSSITKSSSIFTPLFLGGYLIKEFEDYNADKDKEEPLIQDKDNINSLKEIMVKKIEDYSKNPNFPKHSNFRFIVLWWSKLSSSPNDAKKYMLNLLKSRKGLVMILTGFKTFSTSQSLGDYVATRKDMIDVKSLNSLVGTDKINSAIEKFSKGKIKKEETHLFTLYNNSLKGDND